MLCELLVIGNATYKILETQTGYRIQSFESENSLECKKGELNESIYSLIEAIGA